MSTYLGMHPESYCTQCGAPMYLIFDRMCPSCNCNGLSSIRAELELDPNMRYMRYEGKCEHCGGSMWRNARGSLHSCPVSIPFSERDTAIELPALATRSSNVEEITSERASRVRQGILEVLWLHERECVECKRLAKIDFMCLDQVELWQSLRFWEKHITEEK